ncbi:MAG TPA: hypothetical protein VF601_17160 [Beijerinckiaceae bacterium]|jgi:hypothetical protein
MVFRTLAAAALLGATATAALAAGSSAPFDYKPDPALRTESRTKLQDRVRRACNVTQAKLQGASEAAVSRACGCYASRTLAALDRGELEAYRSTGYFNDSARAKALAAIDACGLRRPA